MVVCRKVVGFQVDYMNETSSLSNEKFIYFCGDENNEENPKI
jgi:hypothetical protein